MTYAEQQFQLWANKLANHPDEHPASDVITAIDAYQPYDFQPGHSWAAIQQAWFEAPKTTCRSLALAALVDIEHAIKETQ